MTVRSFDGFVKFAEYLEMVVLAQHEMKKHALERCAVVVEKAAKDKIGEYQPAAGPFATWAPLADSTKAQRRSLGFPEDEPLLRTGALRDSIEHQVDARGGQAEIGSDSDIAVYQEMGTNKIPPRSFLGSAAVESIPKIKLIVGEEAMINLLGGGGATRIL